MNTKYYTTSTILNMDRFLKRLKDGKELGIEKYRLIETTTGTEKAVVYAVGPEHKQRFEELMEAIKAEQTS